MSNKQEREMLTLSEQLMEITEIARLAKESQRCISFRAHDSLAQLLGEMGDCWRRIEAQWEAIDAYPQSAA